MAKKDDFSNQITADRDEKTAGGFFIDKKTVSADTRRKTGKADSVSDPPKTDKTVSRSVSSKPSGSVEKEKQSERDTLKSVRKPVKSQTEDTENAVKNGVVSKSSDADVKNDKVLIVKKKRGLWTLKITVVSLVLSAFISFLSDLTASSEYLIVTILLLIFLIFSSILFDGIGVAVTSCEISPMIAMASRKIYGAKTALWLLKNNEKVASICNDVIGDIFGIISGACGVAIVAKIIVSAGDAWQRWLTIGISAAVSAMTIGGKAFMKNIAITNSKEFVLFVSRIIAIFDPEERKRKKKQAEQKKKYENASAGDTVQSAARKSGAAVSSGSVVKVTAAGNRTKKPVGPQPALDLKETPVLKEKTYTQGKSVLPPDSDKKTVSRHQNDETEDPAGKQPNGDKPS